MSYYYFSYRDHSYRGISKEQTDSSISHIDHYCILPNGTQIDFPFDNTIFPNQKDFYNWVDKKYNDTE